MKIIMFIFAFRLKLLFLGKKNAPCICVKYSNYALHWDKREKKADSQQKKQKSKFFPCIKYDTDCKKQYFYP